MEIWQCSKGNLPRTYLGEALGANFKSVQTWQDVLERFQKKLGLWKRKYLTEGGRLVLIKSTLASLPVYLLLLFTVPISIANKMEEIMRNFIWGTTNKGRRYHLMAWDLVCQPKEWGGLGIRRIKEMNTTLLCKWIWIFGTERNQL